VSQIGGSVLASLADGCDENYSMLVRKLSQPKIENVLPSMFVQDEIVGTVARRSEW
jgi:hypothetical protein